MSKFTEEWQATKKSLGHMVGVMESMAAKYGDCAELEEVAQKKGFTEGYNLGIKRTKAEICEKCYHKETTELACKYADVFNIYDKLEADQQMLIYDIMQEIVNNNRGRK